MADDEYIRCELCPKPAVAMASFGPVFEMPYCEEHEEQVTEIAAARVKKMLRGE